MPVIRSRFRAHAVEWHVAPAPDIDAAHRAGFYELQRRCNGEICRHAALIRNPWLQRMEARPPEFVRLLLGMQQIAIVLRQLTVAREQHALHMAASPLLEGDAGMAVVICFDEGGVPWCPPLPGMGVGDPYAMSERLHGWWLSWQRSLPKLPLGCSLLQAHPQTLSLCQWLDGHYNHNDFSVGLGTLLAIENAFSSDVWQRLWRCLRAAAEAADSHVPDPGFFPVVEMHARLQARHGLYLAEAASLADMLDTDLMFLSARQMLDELNRFWQMQEGFIRQH